ncbi:MAG: alpha-galactosidase [Myxococcales bacterium]
MKDEFGFHDVHASRGPASECFVYEHGWQSWSPSGVYPATTPCSPRAQREDWRVMGYRPDREAPREGFQAEGLLGLVGEDRTAELFFSPRPDREVASIRARIEGERVVIAADGAVESLSAPSLDAGLAAVGDLYAARLHARPVKPLPAGWCSWYAYWDKVTADDVLANLKALDAERFNVGVVQVDDGYQAGIGDWLECRSAFGDLAAVADAIRESGRVPGLWTAPLLVGEKSQLAERHPDWQVRGAVAAESHWGQRIGVLDVTNPAVAEHLVKLFAQLRSRGFAFHKLDFLYGGALPGLRHEDVSPLTAYRRGLELIREGLGDDAVILGCGAPLLPSIGLVDAMRVSPDVAPRWEPKLGDLSKPAMKSALLAGKARAWMHGRLWVNDPDCVLARADVERPEPWARYVEALGGLLVSSDPLPEARSGATGARKAVDAPRRSNASGLVALGRSGRRQSRSALTDGAPHFGGLRASRTLGASQRAFAGGFRCTERSPCCPC